ncbi:hypothetical protein [Vibrio echinoideorum]|uniref:hypothetical protein n=1 Tax=Vibrio echinoideorum TaxID=2100116 RepID=UPI0016441C0A
MENEETNALNLNISEELTSELREFLENDATTAAGCAFNAHDSNNQLITYD